MGLGSPQTHNKKKKQQQFAAAPPARPAGQPDWPAAPACLPAAVPAAGGGSEGERERK